MLVFFSSKKNKIHYKTKFDFNPILKGMYFKLLYDPMLFQKFVQ